MSIKLIVLLQKGDGLFKEGNYKEAAICFEEAEIEARNIFGVEDPQYALILNNLAEIYRSMGEYKKAEPLYKRPMHPNKSYSIKNLIAIAIKLSFRESLINCNRNTLL